ncbi:MAG: arginase family protein [Bacteroidales bacterium]|nr:arginase family protein [Bacteroidales bacterium]
MDLNDYLNPLEPALLQGERGEFQRNLRLNRDGITRQHLQDLDIALVGVPYYFEGDLKESQAPDQIRRALYQLAFDSRQGPAMADLGDMKKGETIRETLYGLSDALTHLMEAGIFVIVLGGDSLLNLAVLRSLPRVTQNELFYALAEPYLSLAQYSGLDMISDERIHLYHLAAQAHYHTQEQKVWTRSFVHESYRLGKLREHLAGVEPYLRGADGLAVSVNAIKNADAPGQKAAFPNGIYGEDVCQLTGYAGLADHLRICCMLDYFPENDRQQVTARLMGQAVWYAIEGFRSRIPEHPNKDSHFKKFLVNLDEHSLVFYKSERTSRWWMEVPFPRATGTMVIPCHYDDYQTACRHEIPARWLRAYQNAQQGS